MTSSRTMPKPLMPAMHCTRRAQPRSRRCGGWGPLPDHQRRVAGSGRFLLTGVLRTPRSRVRERGGTRLEQVVGRQGPKQLQHQAQREAGVGFGIGIGQTTARRGVPQQAAFGLPHLPCRVVQRFFDVRGALS